MRVSGLSDCPRPGHRPSDDTAPPFTNRRLSYLVRSNALIRGLRSPSLTGEGNDTQERQPVAPLEPNIPSGPSELTCRAASRRHRREGSSNVYDEPGESSTRPAQIHTRRGSHEIQHRSQDKGREPVTPESSESDLIQQLRHEKEVLERQNAELEHKFKQSSELLRSLGHEPDSPINFETSSSKVAQGTQKDMGDKGLQKSSLFLGVGLTPRGIMFLKLLERQMKRQSPSSKYHLDKALDLEQAAAFAQLLDSQQHLLNPRSSWITVCALCHVPRFRGVPVASSVSDPALTLFMRTPSECPDIFNEFHSSSVGTTYCCSKSICDSCYVRETCASFRRDFWFNLDSEYWIKCPYPSCSSRFALRHELEIESLLTSLSDPEVLSHTIQFNHASSLRAALRSLDPRPHPDALVRAARLAKRLQSRGLMCDAFGIEGPLDTTVKTMPVDSIVGSGTLQVPIFVNLLILQGSGNESEVGRECAVCAERLVDVTDGTPEGEARWVAATSGFPGEWTRMIRSFPSPSSLPVCSRNHDLDICNTCLAQHIATQLESRGRAGSEQLTCPSPGCGHAYSHDEIRMLASPEAFVQYDKLRLLGHLATLPNFRWCLREGCQMGQVYDFSAMHNFPGTRQRSRIVCDACGFEMCFYHQMPWHEGQTCTDYDANQGDPEAEATAQWLRRNTKPCPGLCGAAVEKKGGCFHMTCQVCRFEFCWECLADWAAIANVDPITTRRRYRRDAHNQGCYFREANAPEATMVAGNTVVDALGDYM
ncbi:hypothetical protein B0T14DRAFT_568818 [Immersiella caudata]|uniref:RBR-type E3 ubiquitin transferase n=1 Tax=Immersiella caudata TaxID=314043 RepID=A0AA40BXJ0_9PEZI|nr:hypothetical protein B0T14DRAFT_568818 [Immersiella caudata]